MFGTPTHPATSPSTTDTSTSTTRRLSAAIAVAAVTATGITGAMTLTATAAHAAVSETTNVSVTPSNDAFVDSAKPTTNYGSQKSLLASSISGHHKVTYLKFSIPAAARGNITSAEVVLDRTVHHLSNTVVLSSTGDDWSQSTITAANAPAPKTRLGSVSTTANSNGVSYTLTPESLNTRSNASFVVTSESVTDVAAFDSTEAPSGQPQLVLTYATPTSTPTPAPTPAPTVRYAPMGLAVPGGNPAQFQAAIAAGLTPSWDRLYANNTVPATLTAWPDAAAAAAAGEKLWLSLALPVAALAAGTYDTKIAAFVKTLPAGTRLTTNHEPSNRSKNISPAAFTAAWNHAARVITDASHGAVLPGPVEVQSNVIARHYLDALDPTLVKFVGLDGYDGIGGPQYATKTFAQVSGASFTYTKTLFPHAAVGFAEFNSSRTTGWAQWVADSLAWCKTVGADTAVLFTSLDYWQKTPTELHQLATILNTP